MRNVLTLEYNSAKDLLARDNYQVQIRYTKPSRKLVGLGELRVIGQRLIEDQVVELIISNEDYEFGVKE